jgi:hypothetical protein
VRFENRERNLYLERDRKSGVMDVHNHGSRVTNKANIDPNLVQIKLKVILEEGDAHRFNYNVFKLRFGGDEERRARDREGHPTSRRGDRDERRREARRLCVDTFVSRRRREANVDSGSASEIHRYGRVERGEGCERTGGVLFN